MTDVARTCELANTGGRNDGLRTCELANTGGRTDELHCITCADDGVPMRVVRVDEARGLALCEADDGARSSVEIALVEARPGDTLLVHAAVALVRL